MNAVSVTEESWVPVKIKNVKERKNAIVVNPENYIVKLWRWIVINEYSAFYQSLNNFHATWSAIKDILVAEVFFPVQS